MLLISFSIIVRDWNVCQDKKEEKLQKEENSFYILINNIYKPKFKHYNGVITYWEWKGVIKYVK